jgi:protein gp37
MAQNSKIEWTKHTANLWHGCCKVHAGCDNCYAETLSKRFGKDIWGNDAPRLQINSFFFDLSKYQKLAAEAGEIHRVFVGSMMDIFEKPMPMIDSKGAKLEHDTSWLRNLFFDSIDANFYPNLLFLLLTKRPGNINKYTPITWKVRPPANVMFGTSVSDQATADMLIPQLLKVKGQHFLSLEPQLNQVVLHPNWLIGAHYLGEKINWVIQGGESGPHKRPFELEWAYDIKRQCMLTEVPYFFKQIDKVQAIPADLLTREFPELYQL